VTREELLKQQLTDEQRKILSDCSALYNRLPSDLKTKLEGLMHVFLHEVAFEVKGFDKVTEEMRICVAAEACVLILNRGYDSYSQLRRVTISKDALKRDGEEWGGWAGRHDVDLHWNACLTGMKWGNDNYNIILHEFAHVLDQADDAQAQSIPVAGDSADRVKWEELLKREYPRLKAAHKARRAHAITEYALSTEAEFFSCATESFFERPKELKKYNPEIYDILQDYYGLDPLPWSRAEEKRIEQKALEWKKRKSIRLIGIGVSVAVMAVAMFLRVLEIVSDDFFICFFPVWTFLIIWFQIRVVGDAD
jgi:Mlc titration factor MtfA (ptsG expression regulator)